MAKITVNGKEFNMRFTLGFWERVKSAVDVDQSNLEKRLNDDFGVVAANIVYFGIYYGLPLDQRGKIEEAVPSLEVIKNELDQSVVTVIEETFIEGMTKGQKELVEKVREIQKNRVDQAIEESLKKK